MKTRRFLGISALILVLALATGGAYTWWTGDGGSSVSAQSSRPAQLVVNSEPSPVTQEQAEVSGILPTQETLSRLYDSISPSVVSIQVTVESPVSVLPEESMPELPFGLPFGEPQTPAPAQGQGTGFVYDEQGHIITNNHVVDNATEIVVYFSNGMWAEAELVATDPQADLAVIKVETPEGMTLQPLTLAPVDSIRVGYYVAALGSPFGLAETMTVGIVSALERSMPTGDLTGGSRYSLPDVIQTDTAINPGNSGGPLLNLKGEVVGVNFAINSPVRANSGVGFAIPVSVVEKVVPALIEEGEFTYSYLGISGQTINAPVAKEQELPANTLGVFVGTVVDGGPAGDAGVQANDIIIGIDDQGIIQFEDLISYLFHSTSPGDEVTLHLLRDGENTSVTVELSERPEPSLPERGGSGTAEITIAEAIKTAKAAIADAELMDEIDSASAKQEIQDGDKVWVVTLEGSGQSATVIVDADSGEVVELNVN